MNENPGHCVPLIDPGQGDQGRTQREWLILVPTPFELNLLRQFWPGAWTTAENNHQLLVANCGFGLVVPAAQTMRMIHATRPQRVLLLGIAGRLCPELAIGSAVCFSQVACYGIGAGSGNRFQSAAQMGWTQWAGDEERAAVGERLDLLNPDSQHPRLLVSVTAVSETREEAAHRLLLHPDAAAEDMEGYAVAVACHFTDTPLTIIRGISNETGDRKRANWNVPGALRSAIELAETIIKND